MQIAFKEWAVVCRALASGRQIVILRKGGIVEDSGSFRPEHDEFLLFPTFVHQAESGIVPEARSLLDEVTGSPPDADTVPITHGARVVHAFEIESEEQLLRLRAEHIWSDAIVQERFHRWQKDMVHALILRVHALPCPVAVEMKPEYGGCKSWVKLNVDIDTVAWRPVLDDAEFQRRLSGVLAELEV
jgi:hypothetical protein